jgi:glucose-1-phosphate cytidylyltransferase
MKVGILAGGVGSRLSEETVLKPKPMVEIGGQPILWHIMKHYAHYGFKDFAIALGYKGEYIKKYFSDYCSLSGSITVDLQNNKVTPHSSAHELDWRIDLIDTGVPTNTGGRIKRLKPFLGNETCMLTWGDGVSDIDLNKLLAFHRAHGKLATVTAVRPVARFGHMEIEKSGVVSNFTEKPQTAEGWINGAFFVLEPAVFDYIEGDDTAWDYGPLPRLASEGQLMAYQHDGFWQCMDTIRDKKLLEDLWESGRSPWKVW